ncbi:MAG: hypothetical protein CMJ78_00785 [Planctomycetaceae bacterium]|nr:hypothetical protein [Planctomycetaceae bacterium]
MTESSKGTRRRMKPWLATICIAIAMSYIFWAPLWHGGGFMGGDVYSYYFPQKALFQDAIANQELPLWNNRTGFGYPLVAESQTGVFYPIHWLCYGLLDLNSAYNAVHILHNMLAYVFMVGFCRRLGCSFIGGNLAALIYVYGWFPSRSCVEWAIIGGTWLPAALWCVESFLQRPQKWRFAILLSAVIAIQLLAGHFQIAWITLLTMLAFIASRLWFRENSHESASNRLLRSGVILFTAIFCGYGLASIQLVPTWEFKQRSQRATVNDQHELDFGAIRPWYLRQLLLPWTTYSPLDPMEDRLNQGIGEDKARTNQVEAHLYTGITPLIWAAMISVHYIRMRSWQVAWPIIALGGLLYATGCLVPITQHLPGFSFFQGPGRYGLVVCFSIAVMAGKFASQFHSAESRTRVSAVMTWVAFVWSAFAIVTLVADCDFFSEAIKQDSALICLGVTISESIAISFIVAALITLAICQGLRNHRAKQWSPCSIFAVVAFELFVVSRLVTYTTMVSEPPIANLDQSSIKQFLEKETVPVRVYTFSANVPNLLGVSTVPSYLTFGPQEYVDPQLMLERHQLTPSGAEFSAKLIQQMIERGVTHILLPQPAGFSRILTGEDAALNAVLGRSNDPSPRLHLERLDSGLGRAYVKNSLGKITFGEYGTKRVSFQVDVEASDDKSLVVLTDLMYPGWEVTVDGKAEVAETVDGMFRGVRVASGKHTVVWSYHPLSLYIGAGISFFTLVLLATVAHFRYWRNRTPAELSKSS